MKPTVCVAPMLHYTNRYFRYLIRLITHHAVLYTEMIPVLTLWHGNLDKILAFDEIEHPIVAQLGGDDPSLLAASAKLIAQYGYDAINFNVGCPSPRVQAGNFGACLMLQPLLVAECIQAMQEAVDIPVTIKMRLGVNDEINVDALFAFIERMAKIGCQTFIIHARQAWLKRSPKANRSEVALNYEAVYQLKRTFPRLTIILNGSVQTIEAIQMHLYDVDGVMIGREAYRNPYFLNRIDSNFFQDSHKILSRQEIIERYFKHFEAEFLSRSAAQGLIRPLLGLLHGTPGAKQWRKRLMEGYINYQGMEQLEDFLRYFD